MNAVQDTVNSVTRQVNANHPPDLRSPRAAGRHRPLQEGDQMATMMRWDPFQDLRDAQDEMAQMAQMAQMSPRLAHALGLHGQPQGSGRAETTAWAPALDISERKDAYLVTVENGVLQIVVPKMEEAKPKRIQVRPGRAEVLAASSAAGTEATTPS